MVQIVDFFKKLGFVFNEDLKLRKIDFKHKHLNRKVDNNVYFYQSLSQTKTSFYLITVPLVETEIRTLRKYFWNENEADFIIVLEPNITGERSLHVNEGINSKLTVLYAKASPYKSIEEITVNNFVISAEDIADNQILSKWQFDSGFFWMNYPVFFEKVKWLSTINKDLLSTLIELKLGLKQEIKDEVIAQELLDRMLFIKYLEDNLILNTHFYQHLFNDNDLSFKTLLEYRDISKINDLFGGINNIFCNKLFDNPTINRKYLTEGVCDLIYRSMYGSIVETGYIPLSDFKFNLLPVEFICNIYEIFLKGKIEKGGYCHTSEKLAQLFIDKVIPQNQIGTVLDPSCSTGMFLVVAFRKFLEYKPENQLSVSEKIQNRVKLLSENIFGIEKNRTAHRITLFYLSLQIFRDIPTIEIDEYIKNELENKKKVDLFANCTLFDNIKCQNALNITDAPFNDMNFDYIICNPPFTELKNSDEEISFLNSYEIINNENITLANKIVGENQLSQCFLLKIKDWSKPETRYGFLSPGLNYYSEYCINFRNYFYDNYNVENIYELIKVRDIMFIYLLDPVVALIFSNNKSDSNIVNYYKVENGVYSEKPFELMLLDESKVIKIKQNDLLLAEVKLKDFLYGNEYDNNLISKIKKEAFLDDFISKERDGDSFIHRGFDIWGEFSREKEYGVSKKEWKSFDEKKKTKLYKAFVKKYFSSVEDEVFNKPYIETDKIIPFLDPKPNLFINTLENFDRPRKEASGIFLGERLLFLRSGGSLDAVYVKNNLYFDFSVYAIKLIDGNLYNLFCAIFNSKLINYFVNLYLRKRIHSSYARISTEDIKQIPIPKNLDAGLVEKISNISKDLNEGKYLYEGKVVDDLNNLIYELYNLNYVEGQRIVDYAGYTKKSKATETDLEAYKRALKHTMDVDLKYNVTVEDEIRPDIKLTGIKISLNNETTPSESAVVKFGMGDIFECISENSNMKFKEKVYHKNCVYILKKNNRENWTPTKANEDGIEILKQLENMAK